MAVIQTLDELKDWEAYRVFMRKYLKLMTGGEEPFYVSKARLDFDIRGKEWKGYALLLGKKSRLLAQRMRQAGELFLEGTCTSDGKRIRLQGLSEKYVKGAERTLRRLKLGFEIEGAGGPDAEDDDADGSAGAETRAGAAGAASDEPSPEAQERAWRRVKSRAIGRIREALAAGGPNVGALRQAARAMQRLEAAGDYAGATEALRRVLAIVDGGNAGATAASPDDASPAESRNGASEGADDEGSDGATREARAAEGDLNRLAQRIEKAVELWQKTEQAATRQLRQLQRAIQSSGDGSARAIVQGLEGIRTNLERIDDEASEAAEAARGGDRAAFEAAREDFRRKVRAIESRVSGDAMLADVDENPFVQTRIRATLLASLERLKRAI